MYIYVLYFLIYCFVGWCWESTYESFKQRKLVNRGFMHGPFLPIYGSGAMLILISNMLSDGYLPLTYLYAVLICTTMELLTGLAMEAIFKVRYWDYSWVPTNIKGYVCLPVSLFWGVLAVLMIKYIHPAVERVTAYIPPYYAETVCFVLLVLCAADFAVSWAEAINLRHKLEEMYENSERVAELRRYAMELRQSFNENTSGARERLGSIADGGRERINSMIAQIDELSRDMLNRGEPNDEASDSYLNRQLERIASIRTKLSELNSERNEAFRSKLNAMQKYLLTNRNNASVKGILKRNPGAVSTEYKKELNTIKKASEAEKHTEKN